MNWTHFFGTVRQRRRILAVTLIIWAMAIAWVSRAVWAPVAFLAAGILGWLYASFWVIPRQHDAESRVGRNAWITSSSWITIVIIFLAAIAARVLAQVISRQYLLLGSAVLLFGVAVMLITVSYSSKLIQD